MTSNIAVQRLLRLDSCALSDAMDKLGLTSGTVVGLGPITVPRKIAGRVITLKLEAQNDSLATTSAVHLGARAIEQSSAGDIIALEQSTGIVAGCWGGLLSVAAKLRSISGVIAEGLVRDVDEARGLDFPIYGRGATALTARGRVRERETGGTIFIGGVCVRSGDLALADSTGVVILPQERADSILDVAEQIAAREFAMSGDLLAGSIVSTVMGQSYEGMLRS
jgi:regulator of RNase E activity RraA